MKTEKSKPIDIFDPNAIEVLVDTGGYGLAAEEIKKHFDLALKTAVASERLSIRSEYDSIRNRSMRFWNGVGIGIFWLTGTMIAGAVIGGGIFWVRAAGDSDRRANAVEMASCQRGDTIQCLAAIQDHMAQRENTAIGSQTWQTNRISQLALAYRMATGKDLLIPAK